MKMGPYAERISEKKGVRGQNQVLLKMEQGALLLHCGTFVIFRGKISLLGENYAQSREPSINE